MQKTKPPKPYDAYPLTPHNNGRWCKKIHGRLIYFTRWADDPDGSAALAQYLAERDDLHAGRRPRVRHNGEPTLADALNAFLSHKKGQQDGGELNERGYAAYVRVCDIVATTLGKQRHLATIDHTDLDRLRAALSMGKRGRPVKPNTLSIDLNRARSIFLFANENMLDRPIKYRRPLKGPSVRLIRQAANELGPRMFDAEELRAIIEATYPKMRAMIYLGINCAFGITDCLTLTREKLSGGWVNHPRPKTGTLRRCPLWPETIAAIDALRPLDDGRIFAYASNDHRHVTLSFRRLMTRLGLYRKHVTVFYSLRRTFETVAATAGDQMSVDYIMGHVAKSNDMAAVYRQRVYDAGLLRVSNHVRQWLLGELTL